MHQDIDFVKIGQRIQMVRKERKMTQNELAEICGCSINHLSAVENGTNRPSIVLIIRLSSALNESVDYFLMDGYYVYPQYIIDSQIMGKLNQCTIQTLQVVNSLLDSMLEYQKSFVKENV